MANVSDIRQIFDSYLSDNWVTTSIYWDNVDSNLPANVAWIQPTLLIDFSENATINDGRTRHNGQYFIRIFLPLSSGTGEGFDIAEALIELFQNKTLDENILTYASSIRNIGDGGYGWYQFNVLIPFIADQQITD